MTLTFNIHSKVLHLSARYVHQSDGLETETLKFSTVCYRATGDTTDIQKDRHKKINAYNKLIIVVFTNEMYYMSELKFPIVENW